MITILDSIKMSVKVFHFQYDGINALLTLLYQIDKIFLSIFNLMRKFGIKKENIHVKKRWLLQSIPMSYILSPNYLL